MRTASQDSAGTSEKILRAAAKLFAAHGYGGVSVRAISEEAGTNSALVSYYFGGKQQLYQAILEEQADKLFALAETLQPESRTPLAGILAFMDEVTRAFLREPERMRVIYREFLTPTKWGNDIFRQRMLFFYDRLAEAFEGAKARKSVKQDTDGRRAAFVLISVLAFYFLAYSYEALSESKRLPGGDDFAKLRAVYADYLKNLATGKEALAQIAVPADRRS